MVIADNLGRDLRFPEPIGLFQGQRQIVLDLQGGTQAFSKELQGAVGQNLGRLPLWAALREEPGEIPPLVALDALEFIHRGPCPDLFQRRPAQLVLELRMAR